MKKQLTLTLALLTILSIFFLRVSTTEGRGQKDNGKVVIESTIQVPAPETNSYPKKLRACWTPNFPMVINPNFYKKPGIEPDMLNLIAKQSGIQVEYVKAKNFLDLFNDLGGKCDLSMGGLARTDARDELYQSSHNLGHDGPAVMSLGAQGNLEVQVKNFWSIMTSGFALCIYFITLVFLMVLAAFHMIIHTEPSQHHNRMMDYVIRYCRSFIWVDQYFMTSGGDTDPTNLKSYPLKKLANVGGAIFNGFLLFLILMCFQAQFKGPSGLQLDELFDKTVAVRENTELHRLILKYPTKKLVLVDSIEDAYNKLLSGEVDAVVHDLRNMRYAQSQKLGERVVVTEQGFSDTVVFYLPQNSPFLRVVNYNISKIQSYANDPQNNEWRQIQEQYLGKPGK